MVILYTFTYENLQQNMTNLTSYIMVANWLAFWLAILVGFISFINEST